MSWFKKSDESKDALESRYAKLQKEKEKLELRKELRDRERELKRLRHPYQEEARSGLKRAGSRLSKLAGKVVITGAGSYGLARQQLEHKRIKAGNVRLRSKSSPYRASFVAPQGQDISLSGSISRADWSGERNIMNTEFFGQQQARDLTGERKEIDLLGSNQKKKNQRYY